MHESTFSQLKFQHAQLENFSLMLIHTLHTRLYQWAVNFYTSLETYDRFVLPIFEDQCSLPKRKSKEKAKRKRKEEKEK